MISKSWGTYKVLFSGPGYLVKVMNIAPGARFSMQRHFKRSERWIVVSGAIVHNNSVYVAGTDFRVEVGEWHSPWNCFDEECIVIEIWNGDSSEEDIERATVVISGGFDPIHSGHVALIKEARKLGGRLVAGLNSDSWLIRKKGAYFMPYSEREAVLSMMVDEVVAFDDSDDTAIDLLRKLPGKLVFVNGGDRTARNIPEMVVPGVEFVFGIGGTDKKNSSSWLLERWKNESSSN